MIRLHRQRFEDLRSRKPGCGWVAIILCACDTKKAMEQADRRMQNSRIEKRRVHYIGEMGIIFHGIVSPHWIASKENDLLDRSKVHLGPIQGDDGWMDGWMAVVSLLVFRQTRPMGYRQLLHHCYLPHRRRTDAVGQIPHPTYPTELTAQTIAIYIYIIYFLYASHSISVGLRVDAFWWLLSHSVVA